MAAHGRHRGQNKKLIEAARWWARGCPGSDIAQVVADLRERGWNIDAIALEIAEAERLAEPGTIWPENWDTAQVFARCEWTVIADSGVARYQGIAAHEIECVMRALRIPGAERWRVFDGVRAMAHAAAPIINEAGARD